MKKVKLVLFCILIFSYNLFAQDFSTYSQALEIIKRSYVDDEKINIDRLNKGALKQMVLGIDPYGEFYTKQEYEEMQKQKEKAGIGISWGVKEKAFYILSIEEDSPAFYSILQPGDYVTKINNNEIYHTGTSIADLDNKCRGNVGDKIVFEFVREKIEKPIIVTLSYQEFEQVIFHTFDKILYIKLKNLYDSTYQSFMEKIKQINEKEYDGMIIDLRDNSEGSINNAYNIANIFLKENTVFSIIKKKKGNESMIISQFDKKMLDIPLIVLINKNTAKYSEVLAASFKDNQRAVIIGQPSSGLAFHQESFTLSDGSIAKFTTGYYLSPSEKEIHGKGVSPDITIEKEYEIEKNENVKIRIEKDTVIQRAKEFIKFFKK